MTEGRVASFEGSQAGSLTVHRFSSVFADDIQPLGTDERSTFAMSSGLDAKEGTESVVTASVRHALVSELNLALEQCPALIWTSKANRGTFFYGEPPLAADETVSPAIPRSVCDLVPLSRNDAFIRMQCRIKLAAGEAVITQTRRWSQTVLRREAGIAGGRYSGELTNGPLQYSESARIKFVGVWGVLTIRDEEVVQPLVDAARRLGGLPETSPLDDSRVPFFW